jgi:hypothetical protein
MMLRETDDSCPRCNRTGGRPFRTVAQDPKTFRVLLRCDFCRHRWSIIVSEEHLSPEARANSVERLK